jgi:death on curing protein
LQYITEEDIVAFYREVIGDPHLRYPEGLASAVGRPQQSAFGIDAYPSIQEKAAALMHSLAENQPFIDGNKRIAWISGKLFLQIHGYTIQATDEEALDLFLNRVANGMTVAELADWIVRHMSTLIEDKDAGLG